ncbi:MAG: YhjD/YihY/BrkB family envelope integrity protein [Anaeromyxobacter sp.]
MRMRVSGDELPRLVRLVRLGSRALTTALGILEGEGVRLRAMALTYISLFALVPALVVVFTVVQAFSGTERVADAMHRFLLENLAVGAGDAVQPYLSKFVTNASAASAGLVGGLFLLWSALSLFQNVDRAINDTWGIKRGRSLTAQAITYWMGLTLGPLLLASSLTLASSARSWLGGDLRAVAVAGGVLLTCTFFTVLYVIVPVTKVHFLPAVAGGFAAGLSWELAKWGYAVLVGKIFRYHAIYGSVAAVPIFIFWLFVSWSILLFGARLVYVVQNAKTILGGAPHPGSRAGRELLAGQVMLHVARLFDRGAAPPDESAVASALNVPAEDVEALVERLLADKLLVEVADQGDRGASAGGLVPARPLEKLTLEDVRRAVVGPDLPDGRGPVAAVLRSVEEEAAARLDEVSLRALLDRDGPSAREDAGQAATPATVRG